MKNLKLLLKILIPFVLLGIGFAGYKIMEAHAPEAKAAEVHKMIPAVETHTLQAEPLTLTIETQGTVTPATETTLTAEISAKVLGISDALHNGGSFQKGDILVKLDSRDYEAALIQAKAQVTTAEAALSREKAEAEQARMDWKKLGNGPQPPLSARIPQLQQAEATLQGARAALSRAQLDLERTLILAPYSGRTRTKHIDIGQFLGRGTPIADIFATDYAEIRLPISGDDLAKLGGISALSDSEQKFSVTLHSTYGGNTSKWHGTIARTEGEIDPTSRLTYLVAKVEQPYQTSPKNPAPLMSGLFVNAEIHGRKIPSAFRIPRSALHDNAQLHLIDSENRLHLRPVMIITDTETDIIISPESGISSGDRVSITPLKIVVDGMEVNPDGKSSTSGNPQSSTPEPETPSSENS